MTLREAVSNTVTAIVAGAIIVIITICLIAIAGSVSLAVATLSGNPIIF